jgi:exodeoxyribonuclease III
VLKGWEFADSNDFFWIVIHHPEKNNSPSVAGIREEKAVGKNNFTIVSWNVNGVRSVSKKGFVEWFDRTSPDILCLQETRAQWDQFPDHLKSFPSDKVFLGKSLRPGYSGVATFTKEKLLDTKTLGVSEFDDEGRTLVHDVGPFYLLNCYFPNGQRDHSRVPFKLRYCDVVQEKIRVLSKSKPVVITGDFNTAHHPIDLANPKSNKDTTGFLPHERAWLDALEQDGMVDVFRQRFPGFEGAFTWWSNRPGCRARNIGWRIDYFYVSQELLPAVTDCALHPEVLGSDHCPISLTLDLARLN